MEDGKPANESSCNWLAFLAHETPTRRSAALCHRSSKNLYRAVPEAGAKHDHIGGFVLHARLVWTKAGKLQR